MPEFPTEDVLGYRILALAPGPCVEAVADWARTGQGARWLACFNPHSYATACARPEFAAALRAADWLVPDGVGAVLASRMLGGTIRERVTGFDVFEGVNAGLERRGGGRVFLLGSSEETLSKIQARMAADWPRVDVVGTLSPPFRPAYSPDEIDAMVGAVNAARPDVLWVAMTAPKQELWLHAVAHRLDVRFAAAIGAVFDFYAGNIRRSSPTMQRLGLEWLPRLLQEPRRLWRRTFVSAPVFLWHVLKARMLHER